MIRHFSLAALALFLCSGPAWGDAVPTSISREVSWSITGGSNGSFTNNVTGNFGASTAAPGGGAIAANASQVSNVAPLFLSGSGGSHIDGSSSLPATHAQSVYDVTFTLAGQHSFSASGTLTSGVDGGTAVANFQFTGPGVNDVFARTGNQADLPFSDSGILAPGSYHLFANAKTDSNPPTAFSDNATFFFTLNLTPIPEPLTPALGILALTGLSIRRRRRV
jgi:hypothetical protein